MKTPTISVIMPTYNHADYVMQSIDSVLNQRDVDFEFIITDDGSVDRTRDIVASIHDKRIKFFPYETNRGACIATNELIQRAKGEYIALINSDDCWNDERKLFYQLQIMQENTEIGACFGRARFIDGDGRQLPRTSLTFGEVFNQKNKSRGKWLRHFYEHGNCLCHPTMLIRRSCYQKLGLYNNRLRQLPDFDMWVRLVKHYEIFVTDRELTDFRIMPGENASSPTPDNTIRTINEHYLIADKFFDDVNGELLIEGFGDLLIRSDIPTMEHLNIEKALLYFVDNRWLGKPYKIIGLIKLNNLLNDEKHREILIESYGIDDKWFQKKMGEVDVLCPRILATASHSKFLIKDLFRRLLCKILKREVTISSAT